MPVKKKHILFISHQASRSGAPVLLLNIIEEIKKQTSFSFRILLISDGALANDFKSLGKTYIWKKKASLKSTTFVGKIERIIYGLLSIIRKRYIIFCLRHTNIVFSNTITNGHVQKRLLPLKCPFICYVHELEYGIRTSTRPDDLNIVLKNTKFFLVGSKVVRNNLVINHQVPQSQIKVIYYPVPTLQHEKEKYASEITSFRKKNNIPSDAVIIGVAASNEWRKGIDIFLSLVKIYFGLFPDSIIYFVWMGFKETPGSFDQHLYEFKKYNMDKRTILVSHGADYFNHMACFDIHLLPSREDPYPLVVLDAAAFGIPTVCFSGAGGASEFVEEDCGYCVAYGDLLIMANKLNLLAKNCNLRKQMGLNAREKVKKMHDRSAQTKEIANLIKMTI